MLMNKKMEFLHNSKNLIFYYDDDYFKITTDNLSLANFIKIKSKDKLLVEFGSGLMAIPLLLSTRTNIKIVGIERDDKASRLSEMSIKDNHLEDRIKVINDDINNLDKYFSINSIDIIVCNPPYFLIDNESSVSNKDYLKMARHEGDMTIEMIARLSKIYLKDGGSLFLIQRVDRLFEIRDVLIKNNLAIKEIQFIYHDLDCISKLVLIEARKSGKEHGLKVLKPIILKEDKNNE